MELVDQIPVSVWTKFVYNYTAQFPEYLSTQPPLETAHSTQPNVEIRKVDVRSVESGLGYIANLCRITIQFVTKDSESRFLHDSMSPDLQETSLICKFMSPEQDEWLHTIHSNEKKAYTFIATKLRALFIPRVYDMKDFFDSGDCLMSTNIQDCASDATHSFDANHSTDSIGIIQRFLDDAIFMQDLGVSTKVVRIADGLSDIQIRQVINSLGNMHAKSVAHLTSVAYAPVQDDSPQVQFNQLSEALEFMRHVSTASLKEKWLNSWVHWYSPEDFQKIQQLESKINDLSFYSSKYIVGRECFCHGDLWSHNILFSSSSIEKDRTELSNHEEKNVFMIDWQFSGIGPGLFDLLFLIFSSTTTIVRQRCMTDWLHGYYETATRLSDESTRLWESESDFMKDVNACGLYVAVQLVASTDIFMTNAVDHTLPFLAQTELTQRLVLGVLELVSNATHAP